MRARTDRKDLLPLGRERRDRAIRDEEDLPKGYASGAAARRASLGVRLCLPPAPAPASVYNSSPRASRNASHSSRGIMDAPGTP